MTDLSYSIRQLLHRPGIGLIAVLTLALGIGATTALFAFVNGVLLQSLPYPQPEQIVQPRTAPLRGPAMPKSDARASESACTRSN